MQSRRPPYSKIALFLSLLFILSATLKNQRWNSNQVITEDMNFYYIYLPAAFIYHDITFSYVTDKLPKEVLDRSWSIPTEDGKHHVSKMSCGYAIMLLPFFLAAHCYELLSGGAANGYTSNYSLAICIASFFYCLIALIYQRKMLLCFFDERIVAFTLIALALATNIYMYTTSWFTQSHIFSFCLFSIFSWKTIKWHKSPTFNNSLVIGLLLGLITIVRPNDIIIILFLLLYSIYDRESFQRKFELIKRNSKQMVILSLSFVIAIAPQLIIWKIQTGNFIYYSYQNQGFYFNHPHIIDGLFSFRNGLFVYTPIMLLIIPGFIFAWKKKQKYSVALPVFFALNCFVVFSWWCWWYGASFGMRAMIESYGLLALPLGFAIQEIWQKNIFAKYLFISLLAGCIFLNIFQTLQSERSILHYSDMTFEAYKKIFGRLTFPEGYEQSLEHPDYEYALLGKPERSFSNSFPFLKGRHKAIITIRGANRKFVCADHNLKGTLIADRSKADNWEKFEITMPEFGHCELLSWEKKYVSVDLEEQAMLKANRDFSQDREKFRLVRLDNNKYAIKAFNNKYVISDSMNIGILKALSDTITAQEMFEITSD